MGSLAGLICYCVVFAFLFAVPSSSISPSNPHAMKSCVCSCNNFWRLILMPRGICAPVCLSVCLPVCLSCVCLSACLHVFSVCLPACLSFCLPACLSVRLSVSLPACLSHGPSVCQSACLSVCVCPSVYLPHTDAAVSCKDLPHTDAAVSCKVRLPE